MPPRTRWWSFPFLLALVALVLPAEARASAAGDAFTAALAKGPVTAALAALVGGLAVSLTPCVYPMIAVTVSVFGARESRSRAHAAGLSAAFVAGIVALLVPLGVAAGMTGKAFGTQLQSPWVIGAVSVLFIAMALSMFGAFEMTLPSRLTNRLAEVGGGGIAGAFALGLVCALIATPCTGPVLTGILTWIAKTQDAALGAAAMGAFGLGLGAPFFVVGAFAVRLPKSGRWMLHVKSAFGIVLLVVALYFLGTLFPALGGFASSRPAFLVSSAAVVLIGLALGAVHGNVRAPGVWPKVRKITGVALVTAGCFLLITGALKPSRSLSWQTTFLSDARAQAKSEGRPLIVDFTAAWCIACKELDKVTFADRRVIDAGGRFVAVKIDATNDEDPRASAAMKEVAVRGLPTIVVFDSSGREAARYTDFVGPGELAGALERIE